MHPAFLAVLAIPMAFSSALKQQLRTAREYCYSTSRSMTTQENEVYTFRSLLVIIGCFVLLSSVNFGCAVGRAMFGLEIFTWLSMTLHVIQVALSLGACFLFPKCLPTLLSALGDEGRPESTEAALEQSVQCQLQELPADETPADLRANIAELQQPIATQQLRCVGSPQFSANTVLPRETMVFHGAHRKLPFQSEMEKLGRRHGLRPKQVAALFAALYDLKQTRKMWSADPDGTWGVFGTKVDQILANYLDGRAAQESEWYEVAKWTASLVPADMASLVKGAVEFQKSQSPTTVMQISIALLQSKRLPGKM
mmetsp:Transcript_39666/g.91670  ORF Transcript_39666/g.91670 Transcript_39666/m.91670 type:complete len:311 (+) Transcript_39666:64-996(+)